MNCSDMVISFPGFNGAAVDQPRKCHRPRGGFGTRRSFNGAAVDQPRKWLHRRYEQLTR